MVMERPREHALSGSARRPLVLIGEPNDDARAMLALLLAGAGYDTAECEGGEASIDHARRLTPAVMLLSTTPSGDALTVVRTLRDGELTRDTHLILLTGHGDPEYRRRAFAAGCRACLLKPVDVNQLLAEISRVTGAAPTPSSASVQARGASADAQQIVRECSSSIESAKAALEHARRVSARAQKQVERANQFLQRVGNRLAGAVRN
jgi:CheY-like chemotaxis protein